MQFSLAVLAALVPAIWAQCPSVEFIYARATTEPPQNYGNDFDGAAAQTWSRGYGAAGYSLFTNITALIPDAAGHPVHYPASMGDSMPIGVQDYLSHLGETAQRCPDTKFALGGHSQGGMVTVQVIPQIPANILSRVISVTMFGSPACPTQVSGRCMSYCHSGDFVCDSAGGGGLGGLLGGLGGSSGGSGGLGGLGGSSGGLGGLGGLGGSSGGLGGLSGLGGSSGGFGGLGGSSGGLGGLRGLGGSSGGLGGLGGLGGSSGGLGGLGGLGGSSGRSGGLSGLSGGLGGIGGGLRGLGGSTLGAERRDLVERAPQCTGAAVENLRPSQGSQNAHLAYSADGYYIEAAACFVLSQYEKSKGAA